MMTERAFTTIFFNSSSLTIEGIGSGIVATNSLILAAIFESKSSPLSEFTVSVLIFCKFK